MNTEEFNSWKAETNRSKNQWIVDLIHNGKDGEDFLAFKGGVDGSYFRIDQSGKVEMGKYEGAIPHIGEAEFTVKGVHKCENFDDATQRLIQAIGSSFLLEFVGIRL